LLLSSFHAVSVASASAEENPLRPLAVAGRETFDAFAVPAGKRPGTSVLNKMQLSGTLRGDEFGLEGWSLHAQVFRFDGQSLSRRMADIQTADNIEAVPVTRLFEAYLSRVWGTRHRSLGIRVGLIDLNSQFDTNDTASLMLNSSHGIGPDLSRSGRNGPSIYPVTAAGSTVTWTATPAWTFRLGVFDGVAGSPGRPRAFFAERLNPADGLLAITQTDLSISKNAQVEAGAWTYTAERLGPNGGKAHDRGAYLSYQRRLNRLPHLSFWLRAGIADRQAQTVAAYLGGGLVQQGAVPGRPDDKIGMAIAHAIIGDGVAGTLKVPGAETNFELTYQAKISPHFVIQPDVSYVRRPAGEGHAPDSVGLGIRLVYATAYPLRMTASDPGDPTVPPDSSSPAPGND
jgi:porin